MKISQSDFTTINLLFNSPILDPKMAESVLKGLMILDERIKKFHKKLVKKYNAKTSVDPQGQPITDFGDKQKDYFKDLEKGLKLNLNPHEMHFVQQVRDYLIIEKKMNAEGKIQPPYTPTALQYIIHLIESLTIKKSYGTTTNNSDTVAEESPANA